MTEPNRTGRLARLVDSDAFGTAIAGVIVANAIVLGLETYPAARDAYGDLLVTLNGVFYAVFVVELVLRMASYWPRLQDFFRSGWNIFDLVIIGAALLPGIREQAQLLRLLRLARIVRLVRYLPDARMLVVTVIKSIPAVFSMVVLTLLLLFVYGMLGWSLFGAELPQEWGTIGSAMMTLFILLTLENFPVYLEEAQAVSPWASVFFISYVLLAAFVVFNLLIGIVIGAMEKARESMEEQRAPDAKADAIEQIVVLRQALERLESDLRRQ
ncbi:MAG: ion transporter [Actinomycetota bacterium]|nr:ion transporter [Actinomycetota bacterium]